MSRWKTHNQEAEDRKKEWVDYLLINSVDHGIEEIDDL